MVNDLRPENISFASKSNSVLLIDFSSCTPIRKAELRDLKVKDLYEQNPTVADDMVSLFYIFLYMLERHSFRSVVSKGYSKNKDCKDFNLKVLGVE